MYGDISGVQYGCNRPCNGVSTIILARGIDNRIQKRIFRDIFHLAYVRDGVEAYKGYDEMLRCFVAPERCFGGDDRARGVD